MSNIPNTLAVQKKRIKRIAVDYLGAALFVLLIDIIVLIVALTMEDKTHANMILYFAIPIISVIWAVLLFFSIKRFLLLHSFARARFDNEYTIKIDCKSIWFIIYTSTRGGLGDVLGIIFVDINRQKYVYVLPNVLIDSKTARAEVRKQCVDKTVELVCYKDTRMIKCCDVLSPLSNNILT